MLRRLIQYLKNDVKRYISSTIWVIFYYNSFKEDLNKNGIYKVELLKFFDWHEGFHYFTAKYNKIDVFIKTDLKIGLLSNEINAAKCLEAESESRKFEVPKILKYSLNSKCDYLVSEYIEGSNLSTETALNYCRKDIKKTEIVFNNIVDMLEKSQIIHRDIKPENIIISYKNNELNYYLIDFYFSISTKKSNVRLLEVPLEYSIFLSDLGERFKYKPNQWDDAFSFVKMSNAIGLDINLESLKSKAGNLVYRYENGKQ